MKHSEGTPRRIVFDVPSPLIELLYGRAVLGLDVAPNLPATSPVTDHADAPAGAAQRWVALYESALDQYEHQDHALDAAWLMLEDAAELNRDMARSWTNEQRRQVTETALMPTKQNSPRLERRYQSLADGPIWHVLVLPVEGHYFARPSSGVLLTSLGTFLDDDAWARAITS
jgi:hypothetical protein